MTSRQAKLQQDADFRVMRITQEDLALTQRDFAEKLYISFGGLNYTLNGLMKKGYFIDGIKYCASSFNIQRVIHIHQNPYLDNANCNLHYDNLNDAINLVQIVQETQPHEVFSPGAQPHGAVGFESPKYAAQELYAKVIAAAPARNIQHSLLKINGQSINVRLE